MNTSESDDIFLSEDDSQFRSLSIDNFAILVNEIIQNEQIEDGAMLCFQVFYKLMAESIYVNTFKNESTNLHVISKCIKQLQDAQKFNSTVFLNYIKSEFVTLPIEIIWWLHKNEIVYFIQYCDITKPLNLVQSLLNFIVARKQHPTFVYHEIIPDLLYELLRCSTRPRTGIYSLHRSKTWATYCSDVLNNMLNVVLDVILHEKSAPFVNFLCFIQNLNKRLPNVVIKQFFKTCLNKIIDFNTTEYDVYSAYVYQELWTSERINPNLLVTLEQIFFKYCILDDIVNILEESKDQVNWKHALAAVGVCVKVSSSAHTDAKDVASNFLKDSFKGGKIKTFIKCLLFIRQSCMEKNMHMDYQTWYSLTFGSKSNFKSKYNATFFKFLVSALIELIPYEPKNYLTIQINQSLDAPVKCNSLIHDYKMLCKSRLQELVESPTISYGHGSVTLLHVIEECVRSAKVSSTLLKIMYNQNEEFNSVILPQLIKNTEPFKSVKEMLVSENYLTPTMSKTTSA